jgi:stress response protein YsnF
MTRSEEQLRVHTEQVAATRVRLVRYVVTEEVQVTVPVRREEVRIEEVPLDAPEPEPGEMLVPQGRQAADAGAAQPGGTADLPEEIVLHREEPVVSIRVVPAERVRLRTELVQGQEQVGARLQREQITVDEQPAVPRG